MIYMWHGCTVLRTMWQGQLAPTFLKTKKKSEEIKTMQKCLILITTEKGQTILRNTPPPHKHL